MLIMSIESKRGVEKKVNNANDLLNVIVTSIGLEYLTFVLEKIQLNLSFHLDI